MVLKKRASQHQPQRQMVYVVQGLVQLYRGTASASLHDAKGGRFKCRSAEAMRKDKRPGNKTWNPMQDARGPWGRKETEEGHKTKTRSSSELAENIGWFVPQ